MVLGLIYQSRCLGLKINVCQGVSTCIILNEVEAAVALNSF